MQGDFGVLCVPPHAPKFGRRGDADRQIQLLGASRTEPLQCCLIQAWGAGRFSLGAKSPFLEPVRRPDPEFQEIVPRPGAGAALRARLCPGPGPAPLCSGPVPLRAPRRSRENRAGRNGSERRPVSAATSPRVPASPGRGGGSRGSGAARGGCAAAPAAVPGILRGAGGTGGGGLPRGAGAPGGSWRRWLAVIRRCRAAVAAGATSSVVPGTRRSQSRR